MTNITKAGITKGEEIFGEGTAYIVIDRVVWSNEMDEFINEAEIDAVNGYVLAISNSGSNFPDLVIALTERGWVNDEVIQLPYGSKAVTFKKQ